MPPPSPALALLTVLLASLTICVLLTVALLPLWRARALAQPNARSSHKAPTPQGGGLAIMAAVLALVWTAMLVTPGFALPAGERAALSAAIVSMVLIGMWDDIKPLPAAPRFAAQFIAAGLMLWSLPSLARIFPGLHAAIAAMLLLVAAVWFINLVNFMDGLDWVTVAGMTPACAAIAVWSAAGLINAPAGWIAAALCGGLLGFAFFNRPVAKLFLGDAGSLPIGLTVAWLLYALAGEGHLVAAMLLPLYHCADATITLARRIAKRENLAQAHRSHFYQRATGNGFSVHAIVAHIFVANIALALLAWASMMTPGLAAQSAYLLCGAMIVAAVLYRFSHPATAQP